MAQRSRRSEARRRAPTLALALLGWLTLRSGPVHAQAAGPEPCTSCNGVEQRSGVLLRMSLGLASMQLENQFGVDSELGGTFSFALGYFVTPNLALSLETFGVNAYTFRVPTDNDGSTSEVDARSLALGVSLTYYFPLDFYLSIGPAIGWFLANIHGSDSHLNDARFALDLLAGREWWIGGSWALGVAAQLIYNGADGRVADIDYTWSAGVLFTVTRN
jgi:hypothetical protein